MAKLSSTFVRLERTDKDLDKEVIEFHTVVNGNYYIQHHEEYVDGHLGWIGSRILVTKDKWYSSYNQFLNQGFSYAGIYKMDILGRKQQIAN